MICVIGDIILDTNCYAIIERSAPEANIPIYKIIEKHAILGGAANIANNLVHLGNRVKLLSVCGPDSEKVAKMITNANIELEMIVEENRKTTEKTRVFIDGVLRERCDYETIEPICKESSQKIISALKHSSEKIDAIMFSDYNKGVCTTELCEEIIKYANKSGIPTFVDPKTDVLKYKGCTFFKPNRIEATNLTNLTVLDEQILKMQSILGTNTLLITLDKDGMLLFARNQYSVIKHKNEIPVIKDITGAGDVVFAVYVDQFLKTGDEILSANIANYIAGVSVQTIGNYLVSEKDISNYWLTQKRQIHYSELIEKNEDYCELWKNEKIVFTNGCFDLLHIGHVKLLQYCKTQGSIVILGLNSDSSVKALKGETRPINTTNKRASMILELGLADWIIVFDEETPLNLVRAIKPDILIKGGDYTPETIIGSEYAGQTIIYDLVEGHSSTSIINRILQNAR